LISDSNLEMAKAPRITPDLIAKTNQQISLGLQNIFKNAPIEIKPQLEHQYGIQQINQASELTNRMIGEQHQDWKNNIAYSSQINAESAHSKAMKGNFDSAMADVETTRKDNESLVNAGLIDKSTAKAAVDSARQAALIGKYSYEYEKARKEGKSAENLRNLADNK